MTCDTPAEGDRCRAPCTDMEEAWRDIKVLIVPSLWFEAWGIVVIEAHLRGIPVIASDAGALTEAMLGLDYIVPSILFQESATKRESTSYQNRRSGRGSGLSIG
jgi:hypothetical protein